MAADSKQKPTPIPLPSNVDAWLTTREVCDYLGIHRDTIPDYRRHKGFPHPNKGLRGHRWRRSWIDQWMTDQGRETRVG